MFKKVHCKKHQYVIYALVKLLSCLNFSEKYNFDPISSRFEFTIFKIFKNTGKL
jgi:hypothetical protein